MADQRLALFVVCLVTTLTSLARGVAKQQSCSSADICGSRGVIGCQPGSVVLIDRIVSSPSSNLSCDDFPFLRENCNYKSTCDLRFLTACCSGDVASLKVEYFCIDDASVDTVCHQSPKEAIPVATRHIYPRITQSSSVNSDDVTKQKPPFCQWKITVPKNRSVAFRIHQLTKPSGDCRATPSLLIQYDVANRKRPKYVRGVPACLGMAGNFVYRLEQAAPQVLVWFTPTRFREKLWLSFDFFEGSMMSSKEYVTPNSTSCLETPIAQSNHLTPNVSVVTSSQATKPVREATQSTDRMALIAGLAAVATVAAFFLVVSIVLFCKLHRLRFLSKGFSRLRKMPGGGFDQVNQRQASEKSNHLVGTRNHDYNGTPGDYRQCEPTVYSVARRPSTEADDNFLKHLEMSTPTYAVPYENMRYPQTVPSPRPVPKDNDLPEKPAIRPRAHLALTDEMFKGGKRSPDEFSSRDWIVPDDDVIDITTGNDDSVPGYYRQSSTVENALYDSPDENEDMF